MSAVQWQHKNVTVSDAGSFNKHDADNLLVNVLNNCQMHPHKMIEDGSSDVCWVMVNRQQQ